MLAPVAPRGGARDGAWRCAFVLHAMGKDHVLIEECELRSSDFCNLLDGVNDMILRAQRKDAMAPFMLCDEGLRFQLTMYPDRATARDAEDMGLTAEWWFQLDGGDVRGYQLELCLPQAESFAQQLYHETLTRT